MSVSPAKPPFSPSEIPAPMLGFPCELGKLRLSFEAPSGPLDQESPGSTPGGAIPRTNSLRHNAQPIIGWAFVQISAPGMMSLQKADHSPVERIVRESFVDVDAWVQRTPCLTTASVEYADDDGLASLHQHHSRLTRASKMVRHPAKRIIEVDGQEWEVSAVIEGVGWDAELPVRREHWLSLVSENERRFITPLPSDWTSWTDERLRAEVASAPRSKRRSAPG
jgi:hypothetical protein